MKLSIKKLNLNLFLLLIVMTGLVVGCNNTDISKEPPAEEWPIGTPVTDGHFEGTSWKLAGAYDAQTNELVKEFEPEDAPYYLFTFIDDAEAYTSPSYRYIFLYPENKIRAGNGTEILMLGDLGLFDDILRMLESYAYDEEKNVFKFFYQSDDGKYYLLFKQTEKIPVTDNPHFEGTSWKLAGAYDAQTNELVKEFEPRNHEIFYSFTFYTDTEARGMGAAGNVLDVNLLLPGVMGEVTYLASATYEDANLFSRITGLITSYRFYEEENVFKFFYSDNGREYYLLFKQTVKTPVTDSPHLEGTSWKLAGAYDVQTDELVKEFEPEDAPHYLFTFIDDTTAYSLPSRSIHLYPGNKVIGSKGTFELWLGDQGLFDDILRVLESYVYDEEKNVFKYFYHSEGREYYLLFKQTEEIPVTDNPHFEGTSWKLAGAYDAQTNELVKEFEPRNHEIFYSFTFYTNTQARGSSASGNELYVYLLGSRVMGELTEMASATYEDANLFSRITGLITSYRFDEKENVFKFFYSDNGREYYLLFKQTES